MKSGEEFRVSSFKNKISQSKTNYKGSIFKIEYDMNGFVNLPNEAGKDRFYFYVDKNGAVIPIGSNTASKAYQNEEPASAKDPNKKCILENCAGAIANNGWKVGYKY